MVIKKRRDSNYPSFEHSLDIDFGKFPPESKRELALQMMNLRYRLKKDNKEMPTDKQLNFAWDYLNKTYNIEQKKITDYYRTEKYGKYYYKRATKNIYVRGKLYTKGQYLPTRRL